METRGGFKEVGALKTSSIGKEASANWPRGWRANQGEIVADDDEENGVGQWKKERRGNGSTSKIQVIQK